MLGELFSTGGNGIFSVGPVSPVFVSDDESCAAELVSGADFGIVDSDGDATAQAVKSRIADKSTVSFMSVFMQSSPCLS